MKKCNLVTVIISSFFSISSSTQTGATEKLEKIEVTEKNLAKQQAISIDSASLPSKITKIDRDEIDRHHFFAPIFAA